jgi:hypothetical protein
MFPSRSPIAPHSSSQLQWTTPHPYTTRIIQQLHHRGDHLQYLPLSTIDQVRDSVPPVTDHPLLRHITRIEIAVEGIQMMARVDSTDLKDQPRIL